jgi:hypothetical protein
MSAGGREALPDDPDPAWDEWWAAEPRREQLFEETWRQMSEPHGSRTTAALRLNVPPRTAYRWRNHLAWRWRWRSLTNTRREQFQEDLVQIDSWAMNYLRYHVRDDPRAALEVLHRRGILPRIPEKIEVTKRETALHLIRAEDAAKLTTDQLLQLLRATIAEDQEEMKILAGRNRPTGDAP